jgi:CBS domain-containing protein
MNVAAILALKGRAVATLAPNATLTEVARLLAAKKIGAVVICNGDGEVAGIISERDIIRVVANDGPTALDRPVTYAMTRDVISCSSEHTLDEIMALMTARRFRHLPVVENGRLAGIVSIGDVVKHHIAEVEMEATAMREYIAHT